MWHIWALFRLHLLGEFLALALARAAVQFNLACRFNTGENQEEVSIVTSSGQYVIAWDFNKVKKGKLDVYEIKKYEDHVVQDNFKFGDDKEIVCLAVCAC